LTNINLKKLNLNLFQFQFKFDYKKKNSVKFITIINHIKENKSLTFTLHDDSKISNITTIDTPPRSSHITNIVCDNINSIKVNDDYKLYYMYIYMIFKLNKNKALFILTFNILHSNTYTDNLKSYN
jgi:hypothetical protein